MQNDSTYQAWLETVTPPTTLAEQKQLHDSHFNYRHVIGEAIYAMVVTCRPDISYAVIKLSQYSANPANFHYKAARQLMKYLALSKDKGITYWRKSLLHDLLDNPQDPYISRPEILHTIPQPKSPDEPYSFVDPDWGGDWSHRRRSVTGLMTILAGDVVAYQKKTNLQSLFPPLKQNLQQEQKQVRWHFTYSLS